MSKKATKGHRRTQSNSMFDFNNFTNMSEKENDKNFRNMIETHNIFDKTLTTQVLAEETRKQQSTTSDKQIVVENIEPPFQELNKYDNSERNFFNFGKKTRNLTCIYGRENANPSSVFKELDFNSLSGSKQSRKSFHDSNPAKRYEREFLKEDNKIFMIPEQNDLLLSTEFANNKINSKSEKDEKHEKHEKNEKNQEIYQFYQGKENKYCKNESKFADLSRKADHFQTLMNLNSNILNAISKTNNRYNSKEEIKTTRCANTHGSSKENPCNNTIKSKKNSKNSLTIKLLKEKSLCNTLNSSQKEKNHEFFQHSQVSDQKICSKHKKNSVSVVQKKEIFSRTMKTPDRKENNLLKLETQMNFFKKRVEVLETQNKNFKQQLSVISEEKNLYIKINEEYREKILHLESLLMKNSEDVKLLENKVNLITRGKNTQENYEKNCSLNENLYVHSNWDISTSGSPKIDGSTFTQYLSKKNNAACSSQNKSYCTPRSNESSNEERKKPTIRVGLR